MMSVKWDSVLLFLFLLMAGYREIKLISYGKGAAQAEKKARDKNPFPYSQAGTYPPANQKTQKQWSDERQAKLCKHCQILYRISPFFHKCLLFYLSFYRQILTQFTMDSNFFCAICFKMMFHFLSYRHFFTFSKQPYATKFSRSCRYTILKHWLIFRQSKPFV